MIITISEKILVPIKGATGSLEPDSTEELRKSSFLKHHHLVTTSKNNLKSCPGSRL